MRPFDLSTVGHSNAAADRFIGLLRDAGLAALADVRGRIVHDGTIGPHAATEARLVAQGGPPADLVADLVATGQRERLAAA